MKNKKSLICECGYSDYITIYAGIPFRAGCSRCGRMYNYETHELMNKDCFDNSTSL